MNSLVKKGKFYFIFFVVAILILNCTKKADNLYHCKEKVAQENNSYHYRDVDTFSLDKIDIFIDDTVKVIDFNLISNENFIITFNIRNKTSSTLKLKRSTSHNSYVSEVTKLRKISHNSDFFGFYCTPNKINEFTDYRFMIVYENEFDQIYKLFFNLRTTKK